jgi:hypothetical protein
MRESSSHSMEVIMNVFVFKLARVAILNVFLKALAIIVLIEFDFLNFRFSTPSVSVLIGETSNQLMFVPLVQENS